MQMYWKKRQVLFSKIIKVCSRNRFSKSFVTFNFTFSFYQLEFGSPIVTHLSIHFFFRFHFYYFVRKVYVSSILLMIKILIYRHYYRENSFFLREIVACEVIIIYYCLSYLWKWSLAENFKCYLILSLQ